MSDALEMARLRYNAEAGDKDSRDCRAEIDWLRNGIREAIAELKAARADMHNPVWNNWARVQILQLRRLLNGPPQ